MSRQFFQALKASSATKCNRFLFPSITFCKGWRSAKQQPIFSCQKPSALTFCEILCRPFCGNPLHPNTSMHILFIFPFFQQGDFVEKARAPLVGYHFLYPHDLYVWLRGDIVRSNKTLFSLRGHSSLLEVTGLRGWPPEWREGLLKEKYLAWQHKTMSPIRTCTFQPQVYEVKVHISLPLMSLLQNVPVASCVLYNSAVKLDWCALPLDAFERISEQALSCSL